MRALTGFLVAHLFRWLPHRAETGLRPVGNPDEHSPVLVTANFSLTVRRVRRALAGRDAWLLVVNTEGINAWCAAAGGILTEHRVIDGIKISDLARRVTHREILLPALAAPGVDRRAIRHATGFRARFGPVSAKDIPAFLEAGKEKSERMGRFDFGWRHRLDMFLPMNFPVYLAVAAVLALTAPRHLPGFTILFWGAVAGLYATLDRLPGATGWRQSMCAAACVVVVWAGYDAIAFGAPLRHGGWLLATVGTFFAAGFDLAGTVSPRRSDAEILMHRLGFDRFGSVFVAKPLGTVRLDQERCRGCGTCLEICPVGVFGGLDGEKRMTFLDREACFSCGACVKQCPEGALDLAGAP